jgi:hypothetical protein
MPTSTLEKHLCQIGAAIGATEAAAFRVARRFSSDERLQTLTHVRPDNAARAVRDQAIAAFKEISIPCVEQSKDGAIEIMDSGNENGKQFCLVVLKRGVAKPKGVMTFIVRCRDLDEARSKLSHAKSGSGLDKHLFGSRAFDLFVTTGLVALVLTIAFAIVLSLPRPAQYPGIVAIALLVVALAWRWWKGRSTPPMPPPAPSPAALPVGPRFPAPLVAHARVPDGEPAAG